LAPILFTTSFLSPSGLNSLRLSLLTLSLSWNKTGFSHIYSPLSSSRHPSSLPKPKFSADPRLHSRWERVCHIHTAPYLSQQRCSMFANSQFSASPFEQEPVLDRLGLLNILSAKPSLPLPDSLGNFNNPFVILSLTRSLPRMNPAPFQISRQFPLPASTALPHFLQSLDLIRPPGPPQNIGRFAPSTFNDRYRSDNASKQ